MLLVLLLGAFGVVSGSEPTPWSCNLCPVGACVTDSRCPLVDNPLNPTTLPHATNCNQFYMCSHGQACEMTCPAGLDWSQALRRCEWPNVACCNPAVPCLPGCPEVCTTIPPPITTTTTTTTTTTAAPPGTTLPDTPCLPCMQCTADARCPVNENPDQPTLLPHENDCTRFYMCVLGERCPIQCPPGEHFSAQLQRCDWPHFACCDRTIQCQQFPPAPADPTVPPSENCRPDAGCPITENDPLNPLLLPVPGNCGAFYKCRTGDACLLPCPTGQHFSRVLQRCERPETACCDPNVTCCAACVQSKLQELQGLLGIES
uniref:Chitin-binding type-2 domain-containing protein n=1 Tax=Anopheles dirus TaxID=7168 RepID=A0A182NVR2_9DIPT